MNMVLYFSLFCAFLLMLTSSYVSSFSIGARVFALRRQPRLIQRTVPKICLEPTGPSLQDMIDQADPNALIKPNVDDAAQLARILGSITESMDDQPEKAFATAVNETSWLCSRDLPE